jgi:general secretion pathway protein G
MKSSDSSVARAPGFTLIEVVIVIAILAVLAGAAVPMASKFFDSRARAATRDELVELTGAAERYFEDTGRLPASAAALLANPGVAGWAGPYLSAGGTEPWSGAAEPEVDAWARAYRFSATGASTLVLASAGADGAFGDANDLTSTLDVTPIRRARTLRQLDTLNRAITSYNAQYLPGTPLSTNTSTLLARLVATGYLPSAASFAADGWGDAFIADPPGLTPVVAVTSVNLGGTGSAGAGQGNGRGGRGRGNGNRNGGGGRGNGRQNGGGRGRG